jgi:hypothetical protein
MLTQAVKRQNHNRRRPGPHSELVLVDSGAMTILYYISTLLKCISLRRVAMFGKCETSRCGSYHAFLHGAADSHFKNRSSFFYNFKKRTPCLTPSPPNYALYARDNGEKDGRPLKNIRNTCMVDLKSF